MPPRRGPPARANKPIESFAESVKRELINPECVWAPADCPRACLSSRRTRTPLEAGERPTRERTGRADCLRLLLWWPMLRGSGEACHVRPLDRNTRSTRPKLTRCCRNRPIFISFAGFVGAIVLFRTAGRSVRLRPAWVSADVSQLFSPI